MLALAAVAAFATVGTGTVAAYELRSVMISSFKAPGPRGPVALTKQGSGTLTMAVSLVNLTPNSAYKVRFSGNGDVDGADYLTIMNKPGGRGIVDVHRTNDPSVDKFNVALSSLVDGADYVLWFSKAACGSPNHSANQIMSYPFAAAQTGSFHASTQLTHDPEFESWASTRLFKNGQQMACAKVHTTYAT